MISTLLFLGAFACGITFNLVTQPHDNGSWVTWSILLAATLTLGACATAIAISAIYRSLVLDLTHAPRP